MIIAVDVDGTCVTHAFPDLGKEIGAAPVLKELSDAGHRLVLWTMRSDKIDCDTSSDGTLHPNGGLYLTQAVEWFQSNEIALYGVNQNPDQGSWTHSPKAYAHVYIDDAALGAPLVYDPLICERPFVDWVATRAELVRIGALT